MWPESNISLSDLSAISDLIIVPHSSSVFELSDSSSPIATFIDSPFSSIADFVLTLEQISNSSLLSSVLSYWLTQSRNPSQFNDKLLSLTFNYIFWNKISYSAYDSSIFDSYSSSFIRALDHQVFQSVSRSLIIHVFSVLIFSPVLRNVILIFLILLHSLLKVLLIHLMFL